MHNLTTLSTFLRKLGSISVLLNSMQNRQVAYYLAQQVKFASNFVNTDFQDIADTVADYVAHAEPDDFCPEDIKRLNTLGIILQDVNVLLHKVQDKFLAA